MQGSQRIVIRRITAVSCAIDTDRTPPPKARSIRRLSVGQFPVALLAIFWLAFWVAPAAASTLRDAGPPAFGATLDWGTDAARAYVQRLGARPAVLDKPAVLPVTASERRFVEEFFGQAVAVGAEPSLTLQPTVGLDALRRADLLAAAHLLRTLTMRYGTDATVTLAPEMNSAGQPFGLRPAAYVHAARELGTAVHRMAPRVDVVWSPRRQRRRRRSRPPGPRRRSPGAPTSAAWTATPTAAWTVATSPMVPTGRERATSMRSGSRSSSWMRPPRRRTR